MQTIPRDVMTSHILPYLTVGESVHLLFVLGETAVLRTRCPKDIRHYYDKKLWFLRLMCLSDDSNNFLQSYLYWTNVFEKTWPIIAKMPLPPIDDMEEPLCRSESWTWKCLQEEVESELSHDLNAIKTLRRLIHTRYHSHNYTPVIYCTA